MTYDVLRPVSTQNHAWDGVDAQEVFAECRRTMTLLVFSGID